MNKVIPDNSDQIYIDPESGNFFITSIPMFQIK